MIRVLFLFLFFLSCGFAVEKSSDLFRSQLRVKTSITDNLALGNSQTSWSLSTMLAILLPVQKANRLVEVSSFLYEHHIEPLDLRHNAYIGSVYDPLRDRIYFIPFQQAGNSDLNWHYLDCSTGRIRSYNHDLSSSDLNNTAYSGGAYDPVNNRIYFAPRGQASHDQWHYLDCATGGVVGYNHGISSSDLAIWPYYGAVYDPLLKRIYFVPRNQSLFPQWHYVDCQTGSVMAYNHHQSLSDFENHAYTGGVYDPSHQRIYFIPYNQTLSSSQQPFWHYIDCQTGSVQPYLHGVSSSIGSGHYLGGVYAPTLNRIYLVPHGVNLIGHYIDCDQGVVMTYARNLQPGSINANAYSGGVYHPLLNRIYFVPNGQANPDQFQSYWHYLDCESQTIQAYSHGFAPQDFQVHNSQYLGGHYDPVHNRIYFVPHNVDQLSRWHGLQTYSSSVPLKMIASLSSFNGF
jgi:hypothetical protein